VLLVIVFEFLLVFIDCLIWETGRETNTFKNLVPDVHLDFFLFECVDLFDF